MIYLDYNSTTPVDKRVVEKMLPFFTDIYGNPSSDHLFGSESKKAVNNSREEVAQLINSKEDEVIFCSGATEANNLALLGLATRQDPNKRHIITSKIEHPAVLEPIKKLSSNGFEVTYLDVDKEGVVNLNQLKEAITSNTFLVSIMSANNETGTLQPLKKIGEITRENGVLFHTDAAQAVGHIDINVDRMNIDLLSISGHKYYGPKGVGVLFVRNRTPRVRLNPIILGGEQEKNLRSGTMNVPGIVGIGEASRIASNEMKINTKNYSNLTSRILTGIKSIRPDMGFNGSNSNRLQHTLNICLPNIDNKWLILKLKNYCFSTGSACASGKDEPSHVLLAMGIPIDLIQNSFRISVGINTTNNDINTFLKDLSEYIN